MPAKWSGPHIADRAMCPHCGGQQNLEKHAARGIVDLRDNPRFECERCGKLYDVVRAETSQIVWLRPAT